MSEWLLKQETANWAVIVAMLTSVYLGGIIALLAVMLWWWPCG